MSLKKINPIIDSKKYDIENPKTTIPIINTTKWMEHMWDTISHKNMVELYLPGTHDSGSYSCSFDYGVAPFGAKILQYKYINCFIQNKVLQWIKTQQGTLLDQLKKGARYLDLRVCISVIDNKIRTIHSIYGEDYEVLLDQIVEFIKQTDKEFLVLDFSHFGKIKLNGMTSAEHTKFVIMIQKKLSNYLVHKKEMYNTLESLYEKNHRIFAIYHVDYIAEKYCNLFKNESIWNPWADAQSSKVLLEKIDQFSNTFEVMGKNIFFSLQSCITPNNTTIINSIKKTLLLPFCPKKYSKVPSSLIEIAIDANDSLFHWLHHTTVPYNIVSFDWISLYPDIVSFLINKNNV